MMLDGWSWNDTLLALAWNDWAAIAVSVVALAGLLVMIARRGRR